MSYQIFDNGDCLKIIRDGRFFFLPKDAVTGIEIIREDVIKLCRANCESSIYFRHKDVTSPFAILPLNLLLIINSWVSNLPLPPPND